MTFNTKIEYSDASWNPIRGCAQVSEGCRYCIAARIAGRYANEGQTYAGIARLEGEIPVWTGKTQFVEKHFYDPLEWKQPSVIMTGFMTDLFYSDVPDVWRDLVFAVMALCPQHEFQVVTKHPMEMAAYFNQGEPWERIEAAARRLYVHVNKQEYKSSGRLQGPMRHLWHGVSAEDQETATERLRWLQKTPTAIRCCYLEPLMGPVDLRAFLSGSESLQWVTVAGESGPLARPLNPDWVRGVRDQCLAAEVAFYFKQWGSWVPIAKEDETLSSGMHWTFPNYETSVFYQRPASTAELDGQVWNQVPDSLLHPRKGIS